MTRPRNASSWLPNLIGPLDLQADGEEVTVRRATINFVGGSVVDNPDLERTDITMTAPGGAVGSVQLHVLDGELPRFGGTPKLGLSDVEDETSDLLHTGTPLHREDAADFLDPDDDDETARPRAQWKVTTITGATPTPIITVDLPLSLGDCFVTVHAEATSVFVASGTKGRPYAMRATFIRSAGTLSRVSAPVDYSAAVLGVGAEPGGIDIDVNGNDAIDVIGTGIAATTIKWVTSLHIHIATVPA